MQTSLNDVDARACRIYASHVYVRNVRFSWCSLSYEFAVWEYFDSACVLHRLVFCGAFARDICVVCRCVGLCAWVGLRWAGVCGEVTRSSKLMCEEIKSRRNAKNACHHSVQSFLPTCLLSANTKIEFCRILIMSCVLYECETWSVALKEGHGRKVF